MAMMWFLPLLYIAHTMLVITGDENRLILKDGNNPCEGHIKIFHKKEWGYVGNKNWNHNTAKVACKSAQCGENVGDTGNMLQLPGNTVWLDEMKCSGSENHLWECENPGWNISYCPGDEMKTIKCSNKITISLDRFKCAGDVQYIINNRTGYFCDENWGVEQANLLCGSLNCGTSKEIPKYLMFEKELQSPTYRKIKCSGIKDLDNLWQCATEEVKPCLTYASVICTGHTRLRLKGDPSNVCNGQLEVEERDGWRPANRFHSINLNEACQQMFCGTRVSPSHANGTWLNCSGNVKVDLMDNGKPSKCYGTVHITLNGKSHPVCGTSWTKENTKVVCRELGCGDAVHEDFARSNRDGIMDYVNCSDQDSSLWHCRAKRDNKPFGCSLNAYVVCADSVDVRLMDGPAKCAGRLEVQYEGQWQRVDKKEWTDTNSDVVCKQLGCGGKGKSTNPQKFSQGSGNFLAVECQTTSKNISQCNIKVSSKNDKKEAVGITCKDHKVVFLEGISSCSGEVGIEQDDETFWLSGSKKTWSQKSANTVCRQMDCGEALQFSSITNPKLNKTVWKVSYNCTSNTTTSLFECEKMTPPSDHRKTTASVTCSGNISVNLTKECWGNVKVCVKGQCGGVCKDTWTDQKSVMLCKNLGCGDTILEAVNPNPREEIKVIIKSLHTTEQTRNLNQCNFVRNDTTCAQGPAYVVCSGSIKTRINNSRNNCSGKVEVYYEGLWLPVCKGVLEKLDNKIQNAICGENCGHAVKIVDYYLGQTSEDRVISQIACPGKDEKSLTACNITASKNTCSLGGLRCSSWRKMELKYNKTCSGHVFVYSEGPRGSFNKSPVSYEGWTKVEGERLCKDLKCGNYVDHMSHNTLDSLYNRSFSCPNKTNLQNIWECENETLPLQQKQLNIFCQDEPNVTLSENCGGKLEINGMRVCNSGWNEDYSHRVCKAKGCSKAISYEFESPMPKRMYHHVSCENYQKFGQCDRFEGECKGGLVSVYCVGNVQFNTTEYCGGEIQVKYRKNWENVCHVNFPDIFSEKLCQELGCKGRNKSIKTPLPIPKNLDTMLECTDEHMDIKHCVIQKSCAKPASIYCQGYVEKIRPPPPNTQFSIVPIILGVGFVLLLVILIVVFVRVYIVKKAKRPISSSPEFESGDYEDVTSKANEMEDFSDGRFRSEAEVITEGDARSNSSFPYDDIDEVAEAQPLTSRAATAGPSGDNYIHDRAFDHSSDGVTYEVDDPQENYDDIEASTEITQTKAQVHDSPQTTSESVAVAPAGLVRGDEDYLVPGQDG